MNIRKANIGDAPLIARCVLEAIGINDFTTEANRIHLESIRHECERTDSLYSYLHTLIAELEGKVIGCVVAYPGEIYAEIRPLTWNRINEFIGDKSSDASDYETEEGEYYLDTLCILPQYRGFGYGKHLIREVIEQAKMKGYGRTTLLSEIDHPRLVAYYESMGFRKEFTKIFLGEKYYKMSAMEVHGS